MIAQNKYYKYLCQTRNKYSQCRDWVFEYVTNKLNKRKLDIVEIGCMTDITGRYGNGNSSMFWAEYLDLYGGTLWICDVNQQHLENCASVLIDTFPDVELCFVLADGATVLDKLNRGRNYGLVYLDGSNNPDETFAQFELSIDKAFVLIDDFNEKGVKVAEKYKNYTLFKFTHPHQMALYHTDIKEYSEITNPTSPTDIMIQWADFKE